MEARELAIPRYNQVRYGVSLYGRDAPIISGQYLVGDQAIVGAPLVQASRSSAASSTAPNSPLPVAALYGPNAVRPLSAQHWRRILDKDGNLLVGAGGASWQGRVMIDGSVIGQVDKVPRHSANLRLANPEGNLSGVFTEGQIILIEDQVSYPNGYTYSAYLGGRMGITEVAQEGNAAYQVLKIQAMNAGQLLLSGNYQGSLLTDAVPVARMLNMMGPDGVTASVPGILAYLLTLGGATAIGFEGPITPVPAWLSSSVFNGQTTYISAFVIPVPTPLSQLVRLAMNYNVPGCGFTYWVDWDGTAVIKALPKNAQSLSHVVPKRVYSTKDVNVGLITLAPSPRQSIQMVELAVQSAAAAPTSVRYAMPPGSGTPVLSTGGGNFITGQYQRFQIGALPTTVAADPVQQSLALYAQQLAMEESLKANTIPIETAPDPFIQEGDQCVMVAPEYGANGIYQYGTVEHPVGPGTFKATLQRIFLPCSPSSALVGNATYQWALRVPRFQWAGLGTEVRGYPWISGPVRPELFHATPYTWEGWVKFPAGTWPRASGVYQPYALTTTTDVDVSLSTSDGTVFTVTVNAWNEAGIFAFDGSGKSIIGTFNFAWTDDGLWHHWALIRDVNFLGLWIDGVLKGSVTSGLPALTTPAVVDPSTDYANPAGLRYGALQFMLFQGTTGAVLDATALGDVAFYSWRFSSVAQYAEGGNFTALTQGFCDAPADYPTVLMEWAFSGLADLPVASVNAYVQSLTGPLSGQINIQPSYWLAGISPPF